ncbi:MAG: hypothetical protein ACTSVU_05510 [Promethearchaeota archaeon]
MAQKGFDGNLALQIFKIHTNEILPVDKITPADIVLVSDSKLKKLYLYKGPDSLALNEFDSGALYERILNRFFNQNIYLIKDLKIHPSNSERIVTIKQCIKHHLVNLQKYAVSRFVKRVFLFEGFRNRIKVFKNYENSFSWRSKLSNATGLWKLSIFNVSIILLIFLLLLLNNTINVIPLIGTTVNAESLKYTLENLSIVLWISIGLLVLLAFVNLFFIFFPMKFPIKPKKIVEMFGEQKESKENNP